MVAERLGLTRGRRQHLNTQILHARKELLHGSHEDGMLAQYLDCDRHSGCTYGTSPFSRSRAGATAMGPKHQSVVNVPKFTRQYSLRSEERRVGKKCKLRCVA